MVILSKNITNFFDEILSELECHQDTRAYIVSIYDTYKFSNTDLSKDSITLLFAQARSKQDFYLYQNLGNWIFFTNTLATNHLKHASKDYYDTIARISYYSCYKIINKQWKLFEELSDNYILLTNNVKTILNKNIKLKF